MATNDNVRHESSTDEGVESEVGRRLGRSWVTERNPAATVEELDRLDEFWSGLVDSNDSGEWCHMDLSGFTAAQWLYFILSPDDEGDGRSADEFWEFVTWPEVIPELSRELLEEFMAGALECAGQDEVLGLN